MSAHLSQALIALHAGAGFVIPNAWDAGSARILERAGFAAIAVTSAGMAWSWGLADGKVLDFERMIERVREITDAVGIPVSADLEAGCGPTAEHVHRVVRLVVAAGAAGANLEDAVDGTLLDADDAADRLIAARAAAPLRPGRR